MGVTRLKKKIELNYRRGTTSRYCSQCNHYRCLPVGLVKSPEFVPRCEIMGIQYGRLYNINPKNICDAHDNSQYLKRLKGE